MESPEQMEAHLWKLYEQYNTDEEKRNLLSQWIEITARYIAVWRQLGWDDYIVSAESFITRCRDKQKQLNYKSN